MVQEENKKKLDNTTEYLVVKLSVKDKDKLTHLT